MTNSDPFTGILIFSDANQEWIVPWFMHYLRKHEGFNYPVAFIDIGCSDEFRKNIDSYKFAYYYDARKDLRDIFENNKYIAPNKTWFYKPFAISKSPFERTIYLDLDCQINKQKAFDNIIGYINDLNEISLKHTSDEIVGFEDGFIKEQINTGVLVINFNKIEDGSASLPPKSLYLWMDSCFGATSQSQSIDGTPLRGDQDVLDVLRKRSTDQIQRIHLLTLNSVSFNCVRLVYESDPEYWSKEAYIIHWTGPKGKAYIKSDMIKLGMKV